MTTLKTPTKLLSESTAYNGPSNFSSTKYVYITEEALTYITNSQEQAIETELAYSAVPFQMDATTYCTDSKIL